MLVVPTKYTTQHSAGYGVHHRKFKYDDRRNALQLGHLEHITFEACLGPRYPYSRVGQHCCLLVGSVLDVP